MNSPFISKYHPDSQALMGYAEGLVDRQASLNPEVAAHVRSCSACQEQVREIRESLRIINEVETVEARSDLTASILRAAQQAPTASRSSGSRLRIVALVACVLLAVVLGLQEEVPAPSTSQVAVSDAVLQSVSLERVAAIIALHPPVAQSTPAEDLIGPAVSKSRRSPRTAQEYAQYKAVDTYNDDIAEAQYALTVNPALGYAYDTIVTTQKVRDELYVSLYMDGQ